MSRHVLLWILSAGSLAGGLVTTLATREPTWIERSGSLVVVAALVVEGWTILTTKSAGELPAWPTDEGHRAAKHAIAAAVLGTLVWGWGGPIGRCVVQLLA